MSPTTYNVFINSKHRSANDTVSDLTVYFNTVLSCSDTQYITVNVISFDMMNSMYNINSHSKNNTFQITKTGSDGITNAITTTYTIPFGNYSVITFRDIVNSQLNGVAVLSYNTAQNSYTYSKTDTSTSRYFITPLNMGQFFGISSKTEITSAGLTGSFVNMVNYNKIIIRCENLNFDYFGFENIKDKDSIMDSCDILFWRSKQDIEPFKMISYNNEDASSSFKSNLYNTNVDFIHLRLTNENNEEITDAGEYMLLLQFTINDRNTDFIADCCKTIISILNDIHYVLLQGLSHFGFFKSLKNKI